MVLTKTKDIYMYAEMIKQIEPKRVLDIGMFLKRIGSVSRKVMDVQVSDEVILDTMDFFPEVSFPIWSNIYNHIYDAENILRSGGLETYDLAILLGTDKIKEKTDYSKLLRFVKETTEYFLTDDASVLTDAEFLNMEILKLTMGENIYYLLKFEV